jgi:RNA polymerase sigma factor (sigma-70 family)
MRDSLPKRAWSIAVHYQCELHRFLVRRMRRRVDVEDLKQEIYMRLLRMNEAEVIKEPLAFLYTVAANAVSDHTIAERKHSQVMVDTNVVEDWANDATAAVPDDLADRMSLQRQLRKALAELPSLQAQALILHYQEGLYRDEIAKRLGLSPKSVSKYIARGKARMRQVFWEE